MLWWRRKPLQLTIRSQAVHEFFDTLLKGGITLKVRIR
jgi:hypothetical protein